MVQTIQRLKPTRDEVIQLIDAANSLAFGISVPCPRCGKPLLFEEFGKSFEVKCSDDECISAGCRGI
jgi:uncharacterized protein (DUF983 family)